MKPVSDEMHALICDKLAQIAQDEQVTILFAVESGSRAWGFHSHDSDYDVRFVYARPVSWHLRIDARRDVIEYPISDELDISGWDLAKALKLALRSNAVLPEWLQSPITYAEAPEARAAIAGFCQQVLTRKPVTWHYLNLAKKQMDGLHLPNGQIKLKRYLYTIRPVLALRHMRLYNVAMAPMNMGDLMRSSDLPEAVTQYIQAMIATKLEAGELGTGARTDAAMDDLISGELDAAAAWLAQEPPVDTPDHWAKANELHKRFTVAVPE
ncbi:nucleotidyltransferase domain-containing protein [Pseudorhodobacter sp. E13]|uniref:nucleotidyltransferase domain-containing protein n=1 Tax=Pseudorhodobacter sp. E13 TaxID=2487931 RepID=UPI000F8E4183|nr:nucleotidyltransferase domain-containing protein [Pseudorhodobacter sp. E13]RUS59731.1 nucleotidyltransferase domain-containing protein [Pseudorhodobacter sp. E13]